MLSQAVQLQSKKINRERTPNMRFIVCVFVWIEKSTWISENSNQENMQINAATRAVSNSELMKKYKPFVWKLQRKKV